MASVAPTSAAATTRRSLLDRLASGEGRAAVTFAGQGTGALTELAALVAQRPELRDGLAVATSVLADAVASPAGQASGRFRHGADLAAWAADPEGAPPASYLRCAAISCPLILVTQALLWRSLWEDGLAAAMRCGAVVAAAGHSQGLLGSLLVAEAGHEPLDDALLARYVRIAWALGQHAVPHAHAGPRAPLAAVSGVRLERLRPLLEQVNALVAPGAEVSVALANSPRRVVVGGPPATLGLLRAQLETQARDEQRARRDGRRGGAPLRFAWSELEVDVAFHTPALAAASELLARDLTSELPDAAALALAVLSPVDGSDLRASGDLPRAVAGGLLVDVVRWNAVSQALVAREADWILDFGPGTDVGSLTAENLRGRGPRTLALASPEGRRRLTSPGASPAAPDAGYARFAPAVVELPGGRRHLDGRYARHTGRPPVILAGMTPTTADAPIVAAAANAGYMAELAGGGQPDSWTFERRVAELHELLEPGREVVFNTLLLDRRLWELHVGREALVVRARRDGAPLAGLTVSAGIPEVEEAVALLGELSAAGLQLNAFKPGTAEQIRQVLAIADAAPQHTIAVHVEGGRGGGHHSWEELDELLLETYDELRRRDNVLLCAGGGVGDPARAAELLCGTWSERYDEPAMPVDAVLVGTAAMACLEAAASPAVKAALVEASGSAGWVARGASAGGVSSGRSTLDADIHVLDNEAARTGRLLEEVAGDAGAVAARRDEIVAALQRTAKPYLGDVEAMTYGELLARFCERCATGAGGRYDDGAWGHPTWRARALALFRRFGARLHAAEAGAVGVPVASPGDLDDPAAALAAFAAAFPAAGTTLLHPADAQFFLEVCDEPGKPVPFVPVLDGEVRRWYLADSLWQAQDARHDAGGVFVIPGPCSVAGIARADEPVAELLARFETEAVARVIGGGGVPRRRERLADPGPAPQPLAAAIAGHGGPVAALCGAPALLVAERGATRSRPNPLWRLVAPGDELSAVLGDRGELARVEVLPAGAVGERLEVAADGDEVVVTVAMPALDGPAGELVMRWRPAGAGTFEAVGGDAAAVAFAHHVLGAGSAAAPEHPLDPVEARWSCPPGLAAAHGAATAAAHDGPGPDLALTLAWPAIAALLSSAPLAARLAQLVHAGHDVAPGPAWPPRAGEHGRVRARVVALDDRSATPTRLTCRALLDCDRGQLATVGVELAALGAAPLTDRRRLTREARCVELVPGEAEAGWLAQLAWMPAAAIVAGERLTIDVECTTDEPRSGAAMWSVHGRVLRAGELAGSIEWAAPATGGSHSGEPAGSNAWAAPANGSGHPVLAALAALAPAASPRHGRPRVPLAEAHDLAPASMDAFARVGGDHNPLHRCVLAARLGGMTRPIVHGAWTAARASAFVIESLCDGDASALRRWRVELVAPLALGGALEFTATRVAVEGGLQVIEVSVLSGEQVVAIGEALVAAPRTALVFTGQGAQCRGMGSGSRARSRAARKVWERADAHARSRLGFSLLDVVERNPGELRLASGELRRHPAGVLHRTEFTQPALLALAAAQLAELREAGVLGDELRAAGHSIGEFAALHALGVLELEPAIELVHRRGELMQRCVERDGDGASPYAMAFFDPSRAGGRELPRADGVEVVGFNAVGRQTALAGRRDALEALAGRLARGALRVHPSIDVPFHSSLLAPAVDGLRGELERLLGEVDGERLVGRWVPNLVGRPFSLRPDFARDAGCEPGAGARALVIELLARQVAAPVRWVDTQRALVTATAAGGFGARRIVELGPGGAPVLTGLMRSTLAALELGEREPLLLHAEDDRDDVLVLRAAAAAEAPEDPPTAPASPATAAGPATPAGTATAAPHPPLAPAAEDRPLDAGTALRLVLAAQARVRPEQIDDAESLDDLFQGASSRRNQVLLDLGRELGLSRADALPEQPLGELVRALRNQGAHYRHPGPYLRDAIAAGLARALGRCGMTRADAAAQLAAGWGAGPGIADHVLALLALETRPGPSARGGVLGRLAQAPATTPAQGRELVDRAAALAGEALGIELARAAAAPPAEREPASAEPASPRIEAALAASARALLAGLEPVSHPGDGSTRSKPSFPGDVGTRSEPSSPGDGNAGSKASFPGDGNARSKPSFPADDGAGREPSFPAGATDGRVADAGDDDARERLAVLEAEHGAGHARAIAPIFDARRHVRFASAWASARWDLVAAYHDGLAGRPYRDDLRRIAAHHGDPAVAAGARYLASWAAEHGDAALAAALRDLAAGRTACAEPDGVRPGFEIAADGSVTATAHPDPQRPLDLAPMLGDEALLRDALQTPPDLRGEVALVSGASPGSIAAALVRRLLRGGATVVVATSTATPVRRRFYRELYRTSAGPGAELHVLPANLASFADVDALVDWLGRPETGARGRADLRVDPLLPTIVAPFAMPGAAGELGSDGAGAELSLRVGLLGVQRLVAAIAANVPDGAPAPAIVLALSPNHGGFGGDGAYGETKAALEVLLARWRSERGWSARVRILAPRIGWVRGTGLMGAADAVAALVEQRLGVRTFSADEMGLLLSVLAGPGPLRERAAVAPLELDLSGGLNEIADLHGAVAPLAAELRERSAAARRRHELDAAVAGAFAAQDEALVEALPSCDTDVAPRHRKPAAAPPGLSPADLVVIVGAAELGPCGTAAARFDAELGGSPSSASIGELAWLCGLVAYERRGYRGRWVDTATRAEVAEHEIAPRYGEAVAARTGVRALEDDGVLDAAGLHVLSPLALPAELRFEAADERQARTFEAAGARLLHDGVTWQVTLRAGTQIRVPRTVAHARRLAGQLPAGLDLARFGIPGDLLASADRMALVNLACTTEAFAAAGLTPEELLGDVHPALVASTQGCGMGGMASLRRLLHDGLLDGERQADRLQESLGNVVAAHAVQSYLGSYGSMVHPVAACATAAVSLEEAHDKIRAGKALAVLAGGFDDLTPEGVLGFGDMGATVSSDDLDALGLAPHEASRANDVRRRGFVEAQGGGALLVVRGDVALRLGLPVRGVLAHASSHADGVQASIPAAGMGVLAAALGGLGSPLARALERLGLSADDIAVVSKHDTSTEMNDPNEADLHERIQAAIGRTPGNPLLVVSQKTVTGHAKGGAAAWQVEGVLQMLEHGVVPGNRNLECADPLLRDGAWLTLGDHPVRFAPQEPIRAALVASLGFGHVSALLAIVHPERFLACVPPALREDYARRAARRRARGEQRRLRTRLGRPEPVRREDRRVGGRDAEAALLTDPAMRLDADGRYARP